MDLKVSLPKINQYTFTFRKSEPSKNNILEKSPQQDTFEMSVGYFNDLHGQTNNMLRILSGLKGDLKFSGGDNGIGDEKNKAVNNAVIKFMNLAGINGSALGNHELDTKQNDFVDTVSKFNGNYFAVNLKQDLSEEDDHAELNNALKRSAVVEVNGEKVGVVGATPIDLLARVTHPSYHRDCYVEDLDDTIEEIQKEIDALKEQGVNKIFLLSHMGLDTDKIAAQKLDGVDVIIGGHTHDLIKNVIQNENLFYSKNNEPVIITQGGKDGEYFGELKLTWDKNGVIVKAQNNVTSAQGFKRNRVLKNVFDDILGKPEHLGEIKSATGPTKNRLIDPNPNAYFIMDAVRHEFNTDLALINVGNVRGFFEQGPVDSRQVFEVVPLKNNMVKLKLTEQEVVEALKNGAKSFINPGNKPSIVIPSGLKYTVTRNGEIKSASYIDKQGKEISIDINNPNPNKIYTVATDDFFASGGDKLISNKIEKNEVDEVFDFDKDKLTCDYIKKLNKPIDIFDDGRITIIDA